MNHQVLSRTAIGVFGVGLLAIVTAEPAAWFLVLVGGVVVITLAVSASSDGSVAAPVLALIALATVFMFVDEPAVGPVAACVLALAGGELLWSAQAAADQGTVTLTRTEPVARVVGTVAIATVVIALVVAASLLPGHRLLTVAAISGLAVATGFVHRRRAAVEPVPLPPPAAPRV